jgi:glyoxylase-like metal-dependent hydrolase (beta-lactamase superfamily II)
MTTLRIGALDVAVVSDGRLRLHSSAMFGPNQADEWREQVQLEDGMVPFAINCVLVRLADRLILLDTGTGVDGIERFGGECGKLLDNLSALGVGVADVDTVAISHAHGDHVGGATRMLAEDQAVPTFPEALYWLWQDEWDHWTKPELLAERPLLALKLPPLLQHGQVELADEEQEIAPGVQLIPTPGHTPGHMCVALTGGREMAIYTGDLLHHAAQLEHPEWSPMFDLLPEMSAASRRRLLEDAFRERATLITAHLPTPGIALPTANGWEVRAAD